MQGCSLAFGRMINAWEICFYAMRKIVLLVLLLAPLSVMAKHEMFHKMRSDTSRRGSDMSVKTLYGVGGYHSAYNASGYVNWHSGFEILARCRFNGAYSFGAGFNLLFGEYNHKRNGYASSTAFVDFKVNFAEKKNYTPYVSFGLGWDWLGYFLRIEQPLLGEVYEKNPYWIAVMPAFGLDFPLTSSMALFVEVRVHYRITDLYVPTFAVGYTF